MCTFCHQHGEGKRWYLQAKNYSADLARRENSRRILKRVARGAVEEGPRVDERIRRFNGAPRVVRWLLGAYYERSLRRDHHGQVVPLEDLQVLLSGVVTSVVRIPCICRKGIRGSTGAYCLAITAAPGTWDETCRGLLREEGESLFTAPELKGVEALTPAETATLLEQFEREGLVHTLWTFGSPFIGGLCNCDRQSCMALKFLETGLDVLAPGETLAAVDKDLCDGCGQCLKRCPFGAIALPRAAGKARVEPSKCYGCGVCRTTCAPGALALSPRPGAPPLVPPPLEAH